MSKICSAEKIYLHGIKNRPLPQAHTLELDFKIQYLFSIITSPAFIVISMSILSFSHPTPWQISLLIWFQSLCLHCCSFSSLSGCKGEESHKKDRCASPLTALQTKQWEMTITKSFWHQLRSLSLEQAVPSLSSTWSSGGTNTPQRFSLLNSNKFLLSTKKM